MAVNITKRGLVPSAVIHKASCNTCGTEFTFLTTDTKYHSDQRDGDYYSLTCPLPGCGNLITINASTINQRTRDARNSLGS